MTKICLKDSQECDALNNNTGCSSHQQCQRRQCGRGESVGGAPCFGCNDKRCLADADCSAVAACVRSSNARESSCKKKCDDDYGCNLGSSCVARGSNHICVPDSEECDEENNNQGCGDHAICARAPGGRPGQRPTFKCQGKSCTNDELCGKGYLCQKTGTPRRCAADGVTITSTAPPATTTTDNTQQCAKLNDGAGCSALQTCAQPPVRPGQTAPWRCATKQCREDSACGGAAGAVCVSRAPPVRPAPPGRPPPPPPPGRCYTGCTLDSECGAASICKKITDDQHVCVPDSDECDKENNGRGCTPVQECGRRAGSRTFQCLPKQCATAANCGDGYECVNHPADGVNGNACTKKASGTTTTIVQTTEDISQRCATANGGTGCTALQDCRRRGRDYACAVRTCRADADCTKIAGAPKGTSCEKGPVAWMPGYCEHTCKLDDDCTLFEPCAPCIVCCGSARARPFVGCSNI